MAAHPRSPFHPRAARVAAILVALTLSGCGGESRTDDAGSTVDPDAAETTAAEAEATTGEELPENPLAGTRWRLVEIQSMSDEVGTRRPDDPAEFTMELNADGTVSMQLGCNRATGSWSVEPSSDPTNGSFRFGELAVTRALCPPPRLDEEIAAQSQYIRGYLLRDGRLNLSLMADGGIWVWEPAS